MKKSYIKLLLFTLISITIFILNSTIFKILNQNTLNILIIIFIVLFYKIFGFEKDRHRYTKDIILEIIIFLISFFLMYYLLGIFIGFAKTKNYFKLVSIVKFVLPMIVYIITKEILRYQFITKSSESKKLLMLVYLLFVIMDNTLVVSAHSLSFNKETFLVIAISIIPSITDNILATYISYNFGFKPNIIYFLIMKLYPYLLPIVPNPNEYLYSIIYFLLPIIILLKIKNWLAKDRTQEVILREKKERKYQFLCCIPVLFLVVILIYFVSGYFRYYAIAIASGSMETLISKGDVVIVDKEYKTLSKKDIIAYNYEGKVIVHRIYKIINNNNQYFIYTKGDANRDYDKYKITKDMIIGLVHGKVPFIGYPTVLLNEKW